MQILDNPDLRRRGGDPFDGAVLEKFWRLHARFEAPRPAGAPESLEAQLPELSQLLLDAGAARRGMQ